MELQCKCHGVSGSCAVKSCWKQMMPFEFVGNLLRRKYLLAIKVTVDQAGKSLTKVNKMKKPSGEAMVFLEDSPDYCTASKATASPGTGGRECNRTATGVGSCAVLCCGRGFDTIEMDDQSKCDCHFHWCCYVKCKDCRYKIDKNFCKAPADSLNSSGRQRKRRNVRSLEMYEKVRKNVFIWFLEYAGTEQPLHGQDVASIIQRRGKNFLPKTFQSSIFQFEYM